MEADVLVDINSNDDQDAHCQNTHKLKRMLKEMKQSLHRAIDLVGGDERDGVGDDNDDN